MKPKYSGTKSVKFWKRVNALKGEKWLEIYTIGVELQNKEATVLQKLREAETTGANPMTIPETILMLLRSTRGEGLTLHELVHELTILRRAGQEMPAVKYDGVRFALETLEAQNKVRHDTMGDQWFYAPVNEPVQGVLFR